MRTTRWIHAGILSAALVAGGAAVAEPAAAAGDRDFLTQALRTLVQGRVISLRKNLVDRPPAKQEQDW